MGGTTAGILFIASLVLALAVAYRPLGDYMYRVVTSTRHLRAERVLYRLIGVNPDGEQPLGVYARSVLAFSAVSILFLYAFLRLQNHLWLSLGSRRSTRTARGTPRSASPPTPTGSGTRASRRWATWCRWPGWRCRPSSPPRSGPGWRWRWSAASPAGTPTG